MTAADKPPPSPGTGSSTIDDTDGSRSNLLRIGLIAFLLGLVLAVILFLTWTGNPFSDTNEVEYRDVVVGPVSVEGDELCWSPEAGDPLELRECAVLALDPQEAVPSEGEQYTIGVVDLAAPGGQTRRQIVFVAPRGEQAPETSPSDADIGS